MKLTIHVTCLKCRNNHEIQMETADFKEWESGQPIQSVAPYLSEDERELLISGVCGKCFDDMFAGEDDDE